MNFKLLAIVIVVAVILVIGVIYLAISSTLASLRNLPPPVVLKNATLSVYLANQSYSFYNHNASVVPYTLVGYASKNISSIIVNATLLEEQPPSSVYIVNSSGECYNCGNVRGLLSLIKQDLGYYGFGGEQFPVTVIRSTDLMSVQPYSVLILASGLMPIEIFRQVNGTRETVLQYLLNRHVSIVYAGGNLNNTISSGAGGITFGVSSVLNNQTSSVLNYIITCSSCVNQTAIAKSPAGYYFRNATFAFFASKTSGVATSFYGPATYENVLNGSITAFSNYPNSWTNQSDAASDIAKAVSQMFWLPRYSSGRVSLSVPTSGASGKVGVLPLDTPVPYTGSIQSMLAGAYGRIVAYTDRNYGAGSPDQLYTYLYYNPDIVHGGIISMPTTVVPGDPTTISIGIFLNATNGTVIQPYINIYSSNGLFMSSIPTSYIYSGGVTPQNSKDTLSFSKQVQLYVPPGAYTAAVFSNTRVEYASAAFNVSPIVITPLRYNLTNDSFLLSITSNKHSLNGGINYSITINRQYKTNGTLTNGTINYALPKGAPGFLGNLNFTISMLNSNFTYTIKNVPRPFLTGQNKQLLEVGVVGLIVFLIMILIKGPNRDEFFIDVPTMTEQKKTEIKLRSDELVNVFDKLNVYFHWVYMPLSRNEFRVGISTNIRYESAAVNLTSENLDKLLNRLVHMGKLAEMDGLYAPVEWIKKKATT